MSTKQPHDYKDMLMGIGGLTLIVLFYLLLGILSGHNGTPSDMGQ